MTTPEELAAAPRAYVVAGAGCGKTELIARAIQARPESRHLVLTHTHAGVKALRTRLRRLGVLDRSVRVDTIAGWAFRYARSYPKISGFTVSQPTGDDWGRVYSHSIRLLDSVVGGRILRASYSDVYVDEYQDCTLVQHRLIQNIANNISCKVVGDPMQAIFRWAGELVDLDEGLEDFERLDDLQYPYRWQNTNPGLGEWLVQARALLAAGKAIDLDNTPVAWVKSSAGANQRVSLRIALSTKQESIAAIGRWQRDCIEFSEATGGVFSNMEPMDCSELLDAARNIDESHGAARAAAAMAFASTCIGGVSFDSASASEVPEFAILESALDDVAQSDDYQVVQRLLTAVVRMPEAFVHRRELLYEMTSALRLARDRQLPSLYAAAWQARELTRRIGRRPELRCVSRTVLIKGLEFDHAVVLDASAMPTRNDLYVAITRGARSLTILSDSKLV